MQSAKDTFYLTLRDRVAVGNPGRTAAVRGQVRPGVLVVENELVTVEDKLVPDAFCLHWTGLKVDRTAGLPLVTMTCEIRYATDGTQAVAGMDRGRALSAMDQELLAALELEPRSVGKVDYSSGSAVALVTNVFWGDPVWSAAVVTGERLERTATVAVYGYQEVGEL